MPNVLYTAIQIGTDPSLPPKSLYVGFFVAFFATSVLLALSPTRFFNALRMIQRGVAMSPRVVMVYRVLAIFCAANALWELYMILRFGRLR